MKVFLLNHTPQPEQTVAAAARLCYTDAGAEELREKMTSSKVESLLKKLLDMGHDSPLEHAVFTMAVEGVSRSLSHQMVRHRIASYSQKSQRYVDERHFTYIVPPSIEKDSRAYNIFEEKMEDIRKAYAVLSEMVPQEDARYILPNACETKYVVTMNARSLRHFFRIRMCRRAQWEIRRLAEMMYQEVNKVAPRLWYGAGPACEVEGYCPEGSYSCGKITSKVQEE